MADHRASLGARSFLEHPEGLFYPTQGSCLVLKGQAFSVGGKEEKSLAWEGREAPGRESWTQVPWGLVQHSLWKGLPCAIK